MIWHRGEILPDDALLVPATDRTFEHGLGLFETARTRAGRPEFLDAHRARMFRSAGELGLAIRPHDFPSQADVAQLLEAEGAKDDQILRITATGGSGSEPSLVWMTARPILPHVQGPANVLLGPWVVTYDDPMARHKALNYWSRRPAFERASTRGFDEVLNLAGGRIWEGSRTNLFVVSGDRITTPSSLGPIVPGILRERIFGLAEVEEADGILPESLREASEAFLTNAIRGIVPIARIVDDRAGPIFERQAPGPRTIRLQSLLEAQIGGSR